ncbi:hypothetical protein PJI17_31455, partial [Mycobacterium kansasii]
LHPSYSDVPFAYLMIVLATHMLVVIPVGEAPIHHLIFNNSNINKMKLELAPGQVDVGGGGAEAVDEEEAVNLPPDDINMNDIFNEHESDSTNDLDYEPSDFDALLCSL